MTIATRTLALLLLLAGPTLAWSQDHREPNALSDAVIESGHSLTDSAMFAGDWPGHGQGLINAAAAARGVPAGTLVKSTIPGSPMRWRREHDGPADAWNAMGGFEALVITENNLTHPEALFPSGWEVDERNARRAELVTWVDRAGSLGTQDVLYYSSWPAHGEFAPAASWRDRLAADEAEWQARVDYAEANKAGGAPRIWMVPGVPLMMRLWDDAEAGRIPGVANGADFLSSDRWWNDDVHPGGLGSLALAYLHLMVLYHVDPGSLPHGGLGLSPTPTEAEAAYIKDVVYDVVANYPRAGVPPLR